MIESYTMKHILYCADGILKNKIYLPRPFSKTSSISDCYKEQFSLIIFDERFLRKRKLDVDRLGSKVCLLRTSLGNDAVMLAKKYNCFDCITDADSKEDIAFKLRRAETLLTLHERIYNLERELSYKNKKIKAVVLTDPLTDSYNWRYFLHRAHQELSRARRHMHTISFIVVDIDYFRQINEVYGVSIADNVIKELAQLLKRNLRKEDVLTRWREDQFFMILPYLSREHAVSMVKRLKERITNHRFGHKGLKLSIKVSLGVVSSPGENVANVKDVINALHTCLVAAKKKGGNSIVFYSQPQQKRLEKQKQKVGVEIFKDKIDKLNSLLTRDFVEMIYGFARAIEAKDSYTGKHVEYTSLIAEKIARELHLPEPEIQNIKHAAVLHDLGKVGIDERILSKRGPLTAKEREIINLHPWTAAEILREIHSLRGAIPAILYHHERFDGKGYPLGLKGEEIPLGARIVAIADVYQALVSDRPYRKAYNKQKALSIIRQETGQHFDPGVAQVFFKVIKKVM
ncbi:MAG: diguanylate cyclase [Candidatus Omnitrophota bacterium]